MHLLGHNKEYVEVIRNDNVVFLLLKLIIAYLIAFVTFILKGLSILF